LRFFDLLEKTIDYVIFRDCDSRLNYKEKIAVDEWIESGKNFHLMYDHKQHKAIVLAGMWGAKGRIIKNFKELMNKYFNKYDKYYKFNRSYDQIFLKDIIWPMFICKSYIAHGDPKKCNYHINKGIYITKFSAHNGFIHENCHKDNFIGETIITKNSRKKPQ